MGHISQRLTFWNAILAERADASEPELLLHTLQHSKMASLESSHLELLSVLNKADLAEKWSSDCDEYMNELSGMGLQQLLQEPQRLREEHTALVDATQELAFNNYKTFVQTATCSRDIYAKFQSVAQRLDSLKRKLPECSTSCDEFSSKCAQITNHWKLTSQTLTKHKKLVEILEIPQLMESCVKNGNYDEALELASYVKRLERRHSPIPLVAGIGHDVRHYQQYMQSQLLSQLRGNIQLPACLKVIGYLRRMELYTQQELKVKFLETRGAWFDSLLAGAEGQDAHTKLSRVMELCRVHLFDIITQYKAIFPPDENAQDVCIFQGWIVGKIEYFLSNLRMCLTEDEECRLDVLMSQCMYFGLSFSRVGVDFRPLLVPIFEGALVQRCENHFSKGYPQCLQLLQTFDLSTMRQSSLPSAETEPPNSAPQSLLEAYPLAVYCNSVLNVFGELRVCCLVPTMCRIASTINQQLKTIAQSIRALHTESLSETDRRSFLRLTEIFATDLVNFIARTLDTMIPLAAVAKIVGCSLPQVERLTSIRINVAEVTKSLAEFVFAHEEVLEQSMTRADVEFATAGEGEGDTSPIAIGSTGESEADQNQTILGIE
ncbi:conserved oligomeric Golgi complex subunit 8 [Galendromus occidentalis]|uniref:Conserved oligomeric Golgi complex subunit 8 n=1 Tax=Galendromus occidentalis TaxID=34638 RepID=A0AAJ6VW32_9ACAR|nr:conserved oligomeric Golgi complex subunit 8 [Galendromus occidentalis]